MVLTTLYRPIAGLGMSYGNHQLGSDLGDNGVSERSKSVHPIGYPMSHSAWLGLCRDGLDRPLSLAIFLAWVPPNLPGPATGVGQKPEALADAARSAHHIAFRRLRPSKREGAMVELYQVLGIHDARLRMHVRASAGAVTCARATSWCGKDRNQNGRRRRASSQDGSVAW